METTPYAGLVTRAIALVVDAVVINVIAVITGAVVALIGSLLGVGKPGIAAALTGGVLWLGWTGLYFIVFWTVTGQTPGARLLGIRVVSDGERRLGVVRAFLRFVVMMLALAPLGAGFVTVLFDDRRRGPHDMAAATVARWASTVPAAADEIVVPVHEEPVDRRAAPAALEGPVLTTDQPPAPRLERDPGA
jgi:uncharacterized RDD family membrane protein YckC